MYRQYGSWVPAWRKHEWWGKTSCHCIRSGQYTLLYLASTAWLCGRSHGRRWRRRLIYRRRCLIALGCPKPKDMQVSLLPVLRDDTPVRNYAALAIMAPHQYYRWPLRLYTRPSRTQSVSGLYEYALMPTRINRRFTPSELPGHDAASPIRFYQGMQGAEDPCGVCNDARGRIILVGQSRPADDPLQQTQSHDTAAAERLCSSMKAMMAQSDAPSGCTHAMAGGEDAGGPVLLVGSIMLPELVAFAP